MKPNEMKTPELDKMKKVSEDSQKIGEFLDWLKGKYEIARWGDISGVDRLFPINENTEQLLADYFNIDLIKCEKERREILENIRKRK